MVNADGLNILAETLCQLYRSAHARFVTFDLNIIKRSYGHQNKQSCLPEKQTFLDDPSTNVWLPTQIGVAFILWELCNCVHIYSISLFQTPFENWA